MFILEAVGPRDLISNSMAGATHGFSLLWPLLAVLIARFVFLDASARYVLVTGETFVAGCARIGKWALWLIFGVILVGRHFATLVRIVLLGTAAHALVPLPTPHSTAIWGFSSWVLGFVLMYWGRYRLVERFSKSLALLLGVSLGAAAILSKPDPGSLLKGLFTPVWPTEYGIYGPTLVVMAVIAAAVGSLSNLKYSAYVHEKGWRDLSFLRSQRVDLAVSVCSMLVMLAMIQVAAAGALHSRGIAVGNVEDLIPIFSQVLGGAGRIVLAVSLWAMVFTSYLGSGTGYGLMFAEIYHRHLRPTSAPGHEPGRGAAHLPAYRFLILYTFLSPLYSLFWDWSPIGLVLVQSASGVVTLPLAIFLVLRLTADKKIMGVHANGWITNIVLTLIVAGTLCLAYQGAIEFLTVAHGRP